MALKKIESHNIEYKSSWRDDYIKWICGFANSDGGKLYIGIDDKGQVKGLQDAKELSEIIPNKVRDALGILPVVKVRSKAGKYYLEIHTERYSTPISYKGAYFKRSGSTNQELKGSELDKLVLQRHGRTWDAVLLPKSYQNKISSQCTDKFKKILKKGSKFKSDVLSYSKLLLLQNLHLIERGMIKKAALLLLCNDPEEFVTGANIRIAALDQKSKLLYQDVIQGSLIDQVEQTMSLLFTKYLKANVHFEGIVRQEIFPYPELAIREALLNAITHKDYSSSASIQIKVFPDRLIIWNPGNLPEDWNLDKLYKPHESLPNNPLIAKSFFLAGWVESLGLGISNIINLCNEMELPVPEYSFDANGISVLFSYEITGENAGENAGKSAGESAGKKVIKKSTLISAESVVNKELDANKAIRKFNKNAGENAGESAGKNAGESAGENLRAIDIKNNAAILDLIASNPSIKQIEISFKLRLSLRTIEKRIAQLKKDGQIIREGSSKRGYWVVVDTDREIINNNNKK